MGHPVWWLYELVPKIIPLSFFDTPLQCPNHQYLFQLRNFWSINQTPRMITMINMNIVKIMMTFELRLKHVFWNYLMDWIQVSSLGFRTSSPRTAKKFYFGNRKLLETFLSSLQNQIFAPNNWIIQRNTYFRSYLRRLNVHRKWWNDMRLLWKHVDRCTNRLVAESWITKGQESRTHWEYFAKIISVYQASEQPQWQQPQIRFIQIEPTFRVRRPTRRCHCSGSQGGQPVKNGCLKLTG